MQVDLWQRFRGLGAGGTTLVAVVAALNADGTSTLTTPEGGTLRALGQDVAVGSMAYVRQGRVVGPAADLPTLNLIV